MAEPVHVKTAIVAPLRMAAVLPGAVLLTCDQALRNAFDTFSLHVGKIVQTPAAVEAFQSRIDNIEESVQLMLNRFTALSAAAQIADSSRWS